MSFFRYPGGKSKLRSLIIDRLQQAHPGGDVEYREPFFGGGSIGLRLIQMDRRIRRIWLNDRDPGIAALWTAVINHPIELKDLVRSFQPSVQHFYEFRQFCETAQIPQIDQDIVDLGFAKLALHQMSYSGLGTKSGGPLGGVDQRSKYPIDCRWSPIYICKKIDRLHAVFEQLSIRYGCCTCFDFSQLLNNPAPALLYLDPPYWIKGNDLYQFGFSSSDHMRLADVLSRTHHRWILSYDRCEEINRLYEFAYREIIDVNYSITATKQSDGKRSSRTKAEFLIQPWTQISTEMAA